MYQQKDIKNVLIAGAGIMGASLAQIYANHNYNVVLYDIAQAQLDTAEKLITLNQEVAITEGRVTRDESDALKARITMTLDKKYFAEVDFVLEAIAEKMPIKHAFWEEVSSMAKPEAVLATNTSGLSITEIAKAVKNPERFAGMHWVNPPHLIPLVEVIAGEKTDEQAMTTIYDISLSLGQKPITVQKDPAGFILNRLQYAALREACNCVQQGYASIEDVDNAMKYGLGIRYACIGPIETVDFGGIDIFNAVGSYLFDELCNDGGVPPLLKEAFEAGKMGVKNCNGFYDYSDGKDATAIAKRDKAFIAVTDALKDKR